MLEWLNEWLKSIIIIILLAAFVDLILPNRSMQRYVKVVVSLFVLMTILTPIVQILVSDFDWEKIEFPDTPIDSLVASVEPIDQIEQDGERIRTEAEGQALDIVKQQVEQMIGEQIADAAGTAVVGVEAVIDQNEEGQAIIRRVDVRMGPMAPAKQEEQQEDASAESQVKNEPDVKPVQPVEVEAVRSIDEHREQTEKSEDTKTFVPVPAEQQAALEEAAYIERQITDILQHEWELSREQIRFIYPEDQNNAS